MPDVPDGDRPSSTRPYLVLRSRSDAGVYEYVAAIDAADADRAIKTARETLMSAKEGADVNGYRDEWHAIPARYWTVMNAETVVPPPETTWSQGALPGTRAYVVSPVAVSEGDES